MTPATQATTAGAELVSVDQVPRDLRPLADPSQEVLVERRPAFIQLAPVPLCQLGAESVTAGEPYLPRAASHHD